MTPTSRGTEIWSQRAEPGAENDEPQLTLTSTPIRADNATLGAAAS